MLLSSTIVFVHSVFYLQLCWEKAIIALREKPLDQKARKKVLRILLPWFAEKTILWIHVGITFQKIISSQMIEYNS
jgi:hypothetical protein